MRVFLVRDINKPDTRCGKCSHHQYLVRDVIGTRWVYIHTYYKSRASDLDTNHLIHWWDMAKTTAPKCLTAYKEVPIKE